MSEMVMRVARAIESRIAVRTQRAGSRLERVFVNSGLYDLDDVARAAIEAMREPTEAMITAARATDLWDVSVPDSEPDHVHLEETRKELAAAFGMMIDEALK